MVRGCWRGVNCAPSFWWLGCGCCVAAVVVGLGGLLGYLQCGVECCCLLVGGMTELADVFGVFGAQRLAFSVGLGVGVFERTACVLGGDSLLVGVGVGGLAGLFGGGGFLACQRQLL